MSQNRSAPPAEAPQVSESQDLKKKRRIKNARLRHKAVQKLSEMAAELVPNVTESTSPRSLFPVMRLSDEQFDVISRLIRSRDPSKSAARLVLVAGMKSADAARAIKVRGVPLSPQVVNNTVTRYKAAHTLICTGYKPRE